MRRGRRLGRSGRALVAAVLAAWMLGAGAVSPATGQETEQAVAIAEIHHSSVFDGAVQCPAAAVRYHPGDRTGALTGDGAQDVAYLLAQCGERYGILRMLVDDTDPATGRPPRSIKVTITGYLLTSGLVSCSTQSVVVDVPDARGIDFFDRTMTLFGCGTWWRTDMQVWYGQALPSVFCDRPPVNWC